MELRRYARRPGQRETLVELLDREFVVTQEAVGMEILGQFRDLDDPDSFVWLRGFSDMRTRKRGLEAFYGGPVWKAHAASANATMIDVDNVLLLRPLVGLELDTDRRAVRESTVERLAQHADFRTGPHWPGETLHGAAVASGKSSSAGGVADDPGD